MARPIEHYDAPALAGILKAPTGIPGLDEITGGGLPAGRPTLVCGSAGCGKTLLAMEFLVRGATEYGEPGVFMTLRGERRGADRERPLPGLRPRRARCEQEKLVVDYVHVERSEIEETGEYDLEGLFIRLGYAIDSIGAKRVVLDTLEVLFGGLPNEAILRAELRRLFRWLKDRGVTAVITGERGEGALTRHGLEEYVSDCVILLDHRVNDQLSTRRLRVVKYRGSIHGTNEYPFLIDERGIRCCPSPPSGSTTRPRPSAISTGIPGLDAMLGGKGFYRGSSVLVSGTAGTGKTSLAAHFADAACRARRALPLLRLRGVAQPDRAQHALDRPRPRALGRQGAARSSTPPGPRCTAWSCTWSRCTRSSASSSRRSWSSTRSPTSSPWATTAEVKAMLMRLIDFLKCTRSRRSSPA